MSVFLSQFASDLFFVSFVKLPRSFMPVIVTEQ